MSTLRAFRIAAIVATFMAPIGTIALQAPAAGAVTRVCSSHVKNDFNGDGHADVAVVQENTTEAGDTDLKSAVRIMYGSSTGITTAGNQYIDGTGVGSFTPYDGDEFGASIATGDFNGDGCADLAIVESGNGTDGAHEGNIFVLYGSPSGLKTSNATVIPTTSIVPSGHDAAVLLSTAAGGDFDGDGFDDLAVGVPFDFDGVPGVGILYGSAGGLGTARHAYLTQSTSGVAGTGEFADEFGAALAAGDFNGDGKADLAVGAPGQTVGTVSYAGSVTVLLGSASGITATGSQQWTESSSGVPGTAETDDGFGTTLAAGSITSKSRADLVVGLPDESIGTAGDAGDITLLRGGPLGLTSSGSQLWDQNSTSVPGTSEADDAFGESLAIGDFNGDGFGDVAVGVPGEAIGSIDGAGEVNVLYGTSKGLTGTGSQAWYQDSTGIAGASETDDFMGASVAALNLTSTKHADLVVGVPGEDSGSKTDNGLLNVILGSTAKSGLTATGNTDPDATGFVNGPVNYGDLGQAIN